MSTTFTPEASPPTIVDAYEMGWYLESVDEKIYGPVTRATVQQFLRDQTITPNTLVRHCTQTEARPAADQPQVREGLELDNVMAEGVDRLAEVWPRRKKEQRTLAEGETPCVWHHRPAVLMCVRCHAPYCDKCRAKPFKRQFYLCKRCQSSLYNRRFLAFVVDSLTFIYLPVIVGAMVLSVLIASGTDQRAMGGIYVVQLVGILMLLLRDSLFGGAGPGKRVTGLRVVQTKDGVSPLTHGQGIVRWLSQYIPFFNLVDIMVPFKDPLFRRYGDRWAGTRVIDSEAKLAKVRRKIARELIMEGTQPPPRLETTMEDLARTV